MFTLDDFGLSHQLDYSAGYAAAADASGLQYRTCHSYPMAYAQQYDWYLVGAPTRCRQK